MSQPEEPSPDSSIRKQSAVNDVQRRILLAGAVLAVIALLFPPWSFSGGSSVGYHFMFSPPQSGTHINSSLLFLELMALGLIAWLLFVAARNVTAKRVSKVAVLIITSSVVLVVVLFAWFVWPKSYTEAFGVRTTRLIGTRYVWSEKRGWITEADKKAEDLADDIQRGNTAKPVLDDLGRMVVERDDGGADHLFIHNPTHWTLQPDESELTVEYYRQKSNGRTLLKIAKNYVTVAPGINDIHLDYASNFVGDEPLLERITITSNSARSVDGKASPTALVPSFKFEYERICRTEYTKTTKTKSDPLTDFTSDDPYLVDYTSKVVCKRYK